MARHPHPEMVRLTARVPRGHEGFWQIIRELDRKGEPWTVNDVHGGTNVQHVETVRDYVTRLVRGGFAEVVGDRRVPRTGEAEKLHRLLKRPTEAPSLRRDGTVLELPGQQRMWNAMRSLKQFTPEELRYAAAGVDRQPLRATTAETYCQRLLTAGYLVKLDNFSIGNGLLRLKPSMNTGPRAPKILRLHVVWDENQKKVIGADQIEAEEVQ